MKRKLLIASLTLPLSLLALASCKGKDNSLVYVPEVGSGFGLKQVKANLIDYEDIYKYFPDSDLLEDVEGYSNYHTLNSYDTGVAELYNLDGMKGIYSNIHRKWIIAPKENLEYTIYDFDDVNMTVIALKKNNKIELIDQTGSIITTVDKITRINAEYDIPNNAILLLVNDMVISYDSYSSKKSGKTLTEIPFYAYSKLTKSNTLPSNKYVYSLSKRIHDSTKYYVSCDFSNLITNVYDEKYNPVNNFPLHIEMSAITSLLVYDNKLLTQSTYELPAFSSEYDYLDSLGNKYDIDTKIYDLKTSKVSSVELSYMINGMDADDYCYNKKNVYDSLRLDVYPINKDKTLGNESEIIVDKKLKPLANVTGLSCNNFVKVNDGYFNEMTHTLYDKNLKLISTYNSSAHAFYNDIVLRDSNTNLYGMLDSKGNIITDFKYKSIYHSHTSHAYLAINENGSGVFFESSTQEGTGYDDVKSLGNDIFITKYDGNKTSVLSLNTELRSFKDVTLHYSNVYYSDIEGTFLNIRLVDDLNPTKIIYIVVDVLGTKCEEFNTYIA